MLIWKKRDVLIKLSFRSRKQFDICFGKIFIIYQLNRYQMSDCRYITWLLYQTKNKFGIDAGICYYGEYLPEPLLFRKISRKFRFHPCDRRTILSLCYSEGYALKKGVLNQKSMDSHAIKVQHVLVTT